MNVCLRVLTTFVLPKCLFFLKKITNLPIFTVVFRRSLIALHCESRENNNMYLIYPHRHKAIFLIYASVHCICCLLHSVHPQLQAINICFWDLKQRNNYDCITGRQPSLQTDATCTEKTACPRQDPNSGQSTFTALVTCAQRCAT